MIILLTCSSYKEEIEKVLEERKYNDVKPYFFRAVCWNSNAAKISLKKIIQKAIEKYPMSRIEIITCKPCTKNYEESQDLNLDKEEDILKSNLKEKCYINYLDNFNYLLVDKKTLDGYISEKSYVITPGWVLKWNEHLKEWGFDKKTSRDFFKESIKKLVLLDTQVSGKTIKKLEEFSNYINMPYEIKQTDLSYLSLNLELIISSARNKMEKEEIQKKFLKASKISADFAMAMDIISRITNIANENDIIKKVMELFIDIFGAGKIVYLQFFNHDSYNYFVQPNSAIVSIAEKKQIGLFNKSYALVKEENGFLISLKYLNEKFGVLKVSEIPSSENLNEFLSLAIIIADVCSLAISNSREFKILEKSKENYKFISFHDSPTSLYNRAFFQEELKRIDKDIERFRPVSIISADINCLKEVNDTIGHMYGDKLIKSAAQILSSGIRKSDILARIGGDEFCILLIGAEEMIASRVIEKIRYDQLIFNENIKELKNKLKVSIALGFSVNKKGSQESIYDTLKDSDRNMYLDKANIKAQKIE